MPTRWTPAGELRKVLLVMQPVAQAPDSLGEPGESFLYVAKRRAKIHPVSGREYLRAMQPVAENTHLINLRWGLDLVPMTAKWELWLGVVVATIEPVVGTTLTAAAKANCRVFQVISATNIEERNREFELMAKETT